MDWQKYLNPEAWHPAAKLFPLMGEQELAELANDIKRNRLVHPITMLGEMVLDGRNRLLACAKAGVEPWFAQWTEKTMNPTEWIISQNLRRRHLTPSQAAIVATGAMALLEQEAKERKYATSKYAPRDEERKLKPVPQMFGEPASGKHSGEADQRAAILFNTNRQYIQDAKLIREKDPPLAEAVKAGQITIPEAKKKLGLASIRWTITLDPDLDRDIIGFFPKEVRSESVKEALRFYKRHQQEGTEEPFDSRKPAPEKQNDRTLNSTENGIDGIALEEAEKKIDESIAELFK